MIDERRPYHRLFSARTMHAARNRMAEYHRTQARDTKARDHHRQVLKAQSRPRRRVVRPWRSDFHSG